MKPVMHWSSCDMDLFLADLDNDLTRELARLALKRLSLDDAFDALTLDMTPADLTDLGARVVEALAGLDVGDAA